MAEKPHHQWRHSYQSFSTRVVDHTCNFSHQSVQLFWRRWFLKVFLSKKIWLPYHITNDVINLIQWTNFFVYHPQKFLYWSDKEFDIQLCLIKVPIKSSLSNVIPNGEFLICGKFYFFIFFVQWFLRRKCPKIFLFSNMTVRPHHLWHHSHYLKIYIHG